MFRQAYPTHSPQLTELFLGDATKSFAAISPENGNSADSLTNMFCINEETLLLKANYIYLNVNS